MTDAEKIASFSWYQTIDFGDGLVSRGCQWCGDPAWKNIRRFLPESLEGMRVLDLGCNAGIFCVRAIQLGAKECIGVDCNDWKSDVDYLDQAAFVKSYFEKKAGYKFNIKYIKGRMEDILMQDMGKFEYVLAIASIYYTTDPEKVVEQICKISSNAIIRLRDKQHEIMYTNLFSKNGFELINKYKEDWQEKLGIPADDFVLFHFKQREEPFVLYQVRKHHSFIFGNNDPVSFFKLLYTVEAPSHFSGINIWEYIERIDIETIAQFKNSNDLKTLKLSKNELAYPYYELCLSLNHERMRTPFIFEELNDGQLSILEGKHRFRLAMLYYKIKGRFAELPAIVVKKVHETKYENFRFDREFSDWQAWTHKNATRNQVMEARKVFNEFLREE